MDDTNKAGNYKSSEIEVPAMSLEIGGRLDAGIAGKAAHQLMKTRCVERRDRQPLFALESQRPFAM